MEKKKAKKGNLSTNDIRKIMRNEEKLLKSQRELESISQVLIKETNQLNLNRFQPSNKLVMGLIKL